MRQAILGFVLTAAVFGQAPDQRNLTFEVASVKPHTGATAVRSGVFTEANQVRIENLSLRSLIAIAYRVTVGGRVDGPNWLDGTAFDIMAKAPDGYQPAAQLPDMLRNLLAERFKLQVHTEAISTSAFALVVAKGGFKLPESAGPKTTLGYRPGVIAGKQSSIAGLTSMLMSALGRQVVNETGLTGGYDIELRWTPFRQGDLESESALMTALQEQLGLKLESRKVAGTNIVVDHVEREPTDN